MRKIVFMLITATVMFSGCKKDPVSLVLNERNVTLYTGDEWQIKTSSSDVDFSSYNEYSAQVDKNGLIKAERVGEAIISVMSGGSEKHRIYVTVKPRHTQFKEPLFRFGHSSRDIINELGTPDLNEGDGRMISYIKPDGGKTVAHFYMFNDSDELTFSGFITSMYDAPDVAEFLIERYAAISSDPILLINGLTPATCTMMVTQKIQSEASVVVYMPYIDGSKSIRMTDDMISKIMNIKN